MDFTFKRLQETGHNKIKSWAGRPKATTKAEDNFISHQLEWQGWLLDTSLYKWNNDLKKCITIDRKEKTLWI